ncbi:MAG: glycosyl hydrolase family 18 protein [Negativicutes bacterium]
MIKRILGFVCCLWLGFLPLANMAEREAQPGDGVRKILEEWRTSQREPAAKPPVRQAKAPGGIRLIWQNIFDSAIDLAEQPPISGITVVSPCWFTIQDAAGTVVPAPKACPDRSYTDKAHAKGYQVWALVTNADFDPEETGALLENEAGRRAAVRNLLALAKEYALDGINLDFENINLADRDRLTGFVQEIAAAAHAEGLTVSVDVTFPGGSENWSQCYDRAALAEAVDYIAVMAYDEHGQSSPEAGSVASLDWVERGLQATLDEVPPEKLLLGMPLYMRRWEEENGRLVKASTLTMEEARLLLTEEKPSRRWLPEAGQYYFEYHSGACLCRVWQEDARSLALKATLVNRYNLAGAAFWRRGHETADIWPTVMAALDTAQAP